MGAASLQLAMTHARFARDKIINGFREGTSLLGMKTCTVMRHLATFLF